MPSWKDNLSLPEFAQIGHNTGSDLGRSLCLAVWKKIHAGWEVTIGDGSKFSHLF